MKSTCAGRSSNASKPVLVEHAVVSRVLLVCPSLLIRIRPSRGHRMSGNSMWPICSFCRIDHVWSIGGIVRAGVVVAHDCQVVSQSSKSRSW